MEVFNNIKKQFDVSQIINKENKNNSNRDLEEVAQEFESLFINEMLKRAHSAKLAKTILTSDAEDTYTSLLNQERSKIFAKNHNFGIAEALVKQFSRSTRTSEYSFNKQQKE
jgi:flagellar protein FlgJ